MVCNRVSFLPLHPVGLPVSEANCPFALLLPYRAVDLIARVEGSSGVHFVRIAPVGARFLPSVRPRPAVGSLITISFVGLEVVIAYSLVAWRASHARTDELDRRF